MPTVVVVVPSTSYKAADFVAAAQGLGVDLIVATEQEPPFDMGDRYLRIDCSDPETAASAIVSLGDRAAIDGVVAADDAGVVVAALAADKLGVAGNPPDAAMATRNKAELRRRLAAGEVPQPGFAVLPPGRDPLGVASDLGLPVVVKPLDRSASQGVIRVDRAGDLGPTVERIRAIVGGDADLMVETYLAGTEVAVEGMVASGRLNVLAVFDKPDMGPGPFFPETIMVTPSRLPRPVQDEAVRVAGAAVRALGLEHGPVHIELKVEEETARVIEVAARSIGGLCSRSLGFGLAGTSLETLIIRNALGLDKPELRRERRGSGVLMIPVPRAGRFVELRGVEEVRRREHVTGIDLTTVPGSRIAPPPEGDRYLGFVFARADTADQVEETLRQAMETLEVVMD